MLLPGGLNMKESYQKHTQTEEEGEGVVEEKRQRASKLGVTCRKVLHY